MPINKLALIRYKTIDNCLQNRYRKWTLDNLIEACSDALYEYEGIKKGISKRTIQLDIQNMRSEKLGYNAPIIVSEKKYYSYDEKDYSITNSPLNQQDLSTLNEVLGVLNQFKGFGYFEELNGMITRLENNLYKHQHKGKSFIDFEKNELLKGLKYIVCAAGIKHPDQLHRSHIYRRASAHQIVTYAELYPYLLKEYRNRWFLLGINKKGMSTSILALDRIEHFDTLISEIFLEPKFDVSTYFNDVIGVSKMPNQKPQIIVMKIVKEHAPYIITKPIHSSQKILKEDEEGTIFSINVIWNFELEREILGFCEQLKVLSPKKLNGKIVSRLKSALSGNTEI